MTSRVQTRIPDKLKEKVDSKLENSSYTYSDLFESALRDFLKQYNEKLECDSCEAQFYVTHLEKTGGECPGCGETV